MKKNLWKVGLLFLGGLVLTGCTASFTTVQDKANMMTHYENTVVTYNNEKMTNLEAIVKQVNASGYTAPSEYFFDYIEAKVVEEVTENYKTNEITINGVTKSYSELSVDELLEDTITREVFIKTNEYSLVKYAESKTKDLESMWKNYDKWVESALDDSEKLIGRKLTLSDVGDNYYHTTMKNTFETYTSTYTATITPENGEFGGIVLEGKSWGYAFTDVGFLEGLLVWPISAMLYYFAKLFSGIGVWGTILSILVVTVIVRGLLLLLTFKQTASQQKMTELQPELAKIQEKYPNADTNQNQKQLMAQEQMNLYKKHNVNPFGMFIILIFQFPIFISVWGAMSGSAILREGTLFGLSLSEVTWNAIINWNGSASIVAIIIFVIMALAQAVSMLLPQYLQKKRTEKVAKLGKNPAKNKNMNQMKVMNIVMLVMIIITGTQLPIAMSIYWIITALISLTQSLIISNISNKNIKNKK